MDINFKEWINQPITQYSDFDVASTYYHHPETKVSELAIRSGKSIGEVYRILRRYGIPNRQRTNHEHVYSFASGGMPINKIAEFTGYTPRNIRYILKNGNNT